MSKKFIIKLSANPQTTPHEFIPPPPPQDSKEKKKKRKKKKKKKKKKKSSLKISLTPLKNIQHPVIPPPPPENQGIAEQKPESKTLKINFKPFVKKKKKKKKKKKRSGGDGFRISLKPTVFQDELPGDHVIFEDPGIVPQEPLALEKMEDEEENVLMPLLYDDEQEMKDEEDLVVGGKDIKMRRGKYQFFRGKGRMSLPALETDAEAILPSPLKKCLDLVRALQSSPFAPPFVVPVNPAQYPDYNKAIPHPICFSEIEERFFDFSPKVQAKGDGSTASSIPYSSSLIPFKKYLSPFRVICDVLRVFSNCRVFNPKYTNETKIVHWANEIEKEFVEKVKNTFRIPIEIIRMLCSLESTLEIDKNSNIRYPEMPSSLISPRKVERINRIIMISKHLNDSEQTKFFDFLSSHSIFVDIHEQDIDHHQPTIPKALEEEEEEDEDELEADEEEEEKKRIEETLKTRNASYQNHKTFVSIDLSRIRDSLLDKLESTFSCFSTVPQVEANLDANFSNVFFRHYMSTFNEKKKNMYLGESVGRKMMDEEEVEGEDEKVFGQDTYFYEPTAGPSQQHFASIQNLESWKDVGESYKKSRSVYLPEEEKKMEDEPDEEDSMNTMIDARKDIEEWKEFQELAAESLEKERKERIRMKRIEEQRKVLEEKQREERLELEKLEEERKKKENLMEDEIDGSLMQEMKELGLNYM